MEVQVYPPDTELCELRGSEGPGARQYIKFLVARSGEGVDHTRLVRIDVPLCNAAADLEKFTSIGGGYIKPSGVDGSVRAEWGSSSMHSAGQEEKPKDAADADRILEEVRESVAAWMLRNSFSLQ